MKKTLLLAGVACVMMTAQAQAGNWYNNMVHNTKIYVGADYAFDSVDFKGALNEAKEDYNSGIFNIIKNQNQCLWYGYVRIFTFGLRG